jgi:hypothetical protein
VPNGFVQRYDGLLGLFVQLRLLDEAVEPLADFVIGFGCMCPQ